jgi:hypothetical protein
LWIENPDDSDGLLVMDYVMIAKIQEGIEAGTIFK